MEGLLATGPTRRLSVPTHGPSEASGRSAGVRRCVARQRGPARNTPSEPVMQQHERGSTEIGYHRAWNGD